MDYKQFFNTFADVVDTGMTHAISFELRRLSSKDRAELSMYLRQVAENGSKTEYRP